MTDVIMSAAKNYVSFFKTAVGFNGTAAETICRCYVILYIELYIKQLSDQRREIHEQNAAHRS